MTDDYFCISKVNCYKDSSIWQKTHTICDKTIQPSFMNQNKAIFFASTDSTYENDMVPNSSEGILIEPKEAASGSIITFCNSSVPSLVSSPLFAQFNGAAYFMPQTKSSFFPPEQSYHQNGLIMKPDESKSQYPAIVVESMDTLIPDSKKMQKDRYKKIKIYDCDICPRSFARKHDLQRHIRIHTGVKPYYCLNCEKTFARTDALKRHLRMEEKCRMSPVIQVLKNIGMRRYKNL